MTLPDGVEAGLEPDQWERSRAPGLVGAGALIVLAIAVLVPRVGPIGAGTFLALFVAVVATRQVLLGHRDKRL